MVAVEPSSVPILSSWQYVLVLFIGSFAGILGGVAAILSARRAKEVKNHLSQKEKEDLEWKTSNIGIANGHGTLMRQMTVTMESVGRLADQTDELHKKLDHHILDSAEYRAGVKQHLGSIQEDLDKHIQWAEEAVYPLIQSKTDEPIPAPPSITKDGK